MSMEQALCGKKFWTLPRIANNNHSFVCLCERNLISFVLKNVLTRYSVDEPSTFRSPYAGRLIAGTPAGLLRVRRQAYCGYVGGPIAGTPVGLLRVRRPAYCVYVGGPFADTSAGLLRYAGRPIAVRRRAYCGYDSVTSI